VLVLQPLIFQRYERIAITIAGARLIAGCGSRDKGQNKADPAYGQQGAPQFFSHLIIDHDGTYTGVADASFLS
jgi:hypothetical protein